MAWGTTKMSLLTNPNILFSSLAILVHNNSKSFGQVLEETMISNLQKVSMHALKLLRVHHLLISIIKCVYPKVLSPLSNNPKTFLQLFPLKMPSKTIL
jgi:hypothetical protein